jgi:allantoate deiminase
MEVAGWMEEAGMSVRQDAICNLIGRYAGTGASTCTLILGSHLDSVRDAGKFDGPLGVLTALACVERLHRSGRRLPFAVEVIAFTDEEGLRFHTSYLGSSAIAGTFNQAWLDVRDADGITVAQAIRQASGDPDAIEACRYRSEDLLGYCEVHIEQGPVLESLDLPVGVVSVIAGQNRANITFKGMSGHAGTVPMRLRHDALCAAAEFILVVEHQANKHDGMVATVGQVTIHPGAGNVIPGRVALSLDVRHQDDTSRRDAYRVLQEEAQAIADRRGVALEWEPVQEAPSTPCAPMLVDGLAAAIESLGYPVQRLSSGAGHDGVPLSHLTEIAMLFVRCKGGISHNPAESVTVADVAVAIEVLSRFLESR